MEHDEHDEHDELHDEDSTPSRPLPPPAERVWRHPSELGAHGRGADAVAAPAAIASDAPNMWTVALVSGLIGAILTFGSVAATGGLQRPTTIEREIVVRENVLPPFVSNPRADVEGSLVDIAERVRPAIVRLDVESGDAAGSGSGVLFRDNGYLLTNAHVVRDVDSVVVILADGREIEGEVVGSDERTDIAVVKIEGETSFPITTLGTALNLKVGQRAIAIGSPLGLAGGPSLTAGYISALGRRLDTVRPALLDMIQTDAPIAPGSSGGALLDESGAVIGITTAIGVSEVGAEGLGFATPIDIARSVADDIIETGRARHPWLGLSGPPDLDAATKERLGIEGGALVSDVFEDSPADDVGIRRGDIIVQLADEPVDSMSELVVLLRRFRPGFVLEIVYLRGTDRHVVEVSLGELPDDFPPEE